MPCTSCGPRLPRGLREIAGHPLPRVDARRPAVPRALREALFWGLDVPGVRAAAGRRLRASCPCSFRLRVLCRAGGARGGVGEGARLPDVPREVRNRDIPVRRAREGERRPARAVGRGRAGACALPGDGSSGHRPYGAGEIDPTEAGVSGLRFGASTAACPRRPPRFRVRRLSVQE